MHLKSDQKIHAACLRQLDTAWAFAYTSAVSITLLSGSCTPIRANFRF
jgi:hypothetical protein